MSKNLGVHFAKILIPLKALYSKAFRGTSKLFLNYFSKPLNLALSTPKLRAFFKALAQMESFCADYKIYILSPILPIRLKPLPSKAFIDVKIFCKK